MTLIETVQPTLDKVYKRLAKEGLRDLTLLEYDRYLNASLWGKIKKWVFERDQRTCKICTANGKRIEMDVHHRSYDLEVLEGKNEKMLVTLCRRCHNLVEKYPDGRKRYDLDEKDFEYLRLIDVHSIMLKEGIPLRLESKVTKQYQQISLLHDPREALLFRTLDSCLEEYQRFPISSYFVGIFLTLLINSYTYRN
ncbi:HNH endonuclease [Teredinibacter purpureus]|uniref:HNH endonuclease n=1 Tax=Teredinibacter purpureus TaxID=2731756 RepID=UPI0005F7D2FC|nr:HNH endonuclease signature motif containing protein [Teredinibacter purpureus]